MMYARLERDVHGGPEDIRGPLQSQRLGMRGTRTFVGSFADDLTMSIDHDGTDSWVWVWVLGASQIVGSLEKPAFCHPVRRSIR